jgi:hypothetical protein
MPTTIAEAFEAAGLRRQGVAKWMTKPGAFASGVYIVSLTASPNSRSGRLIQAPLADAKFQRWLAVRRELTLDGSRPSLQRLMDRIQRFWIPDEVILYIGRAGTPLSKRVGQYYSTPIGSRSPHAGGYFLKLLSNLDQLWVHYAECSDFKAAESQMLRHFCAHVSSRSREALHDPAHPFPFANLEWPSGTRKEHGLRGACGPRGKTSSATSEPHPAVTPVSSGPSQNSYRTQRVTACDLRCGRIRIPAAGTSPTKALFSGEKATIRVVLAGRLVEGNWDPRIGPDRERSGVLRIGKILREVTHQDEPLLVSAGDEGIIHIFTP